MLPLKGQPHIRTGKGVKTTAGLLQKGLGHPDRDPGQLMKAVDTQLAMLTWALVSKGPETCLRDLTSLQFTDQWGDWTLQWALLFQPETGRGARQPGPMYHTLGGEPPEPFMSWELGLTQPMANMKFEE